MSNQKRKVSLDDYILCYQYFYRAIQNNRFMQGTQHEDSRSKAILAFYELQTEAFDEEAVQKLQLWLDEFVDVATWGRCYRALNQKKYLITNNHRTITVSDEAYSALKNSADQKKVSLSQALIELCAGSPCSMDDSSSNRLLNLTDLKPLNTDPLKTNVPIPIAEKDSNVISLFGGKLVESSDEDLDSELNFSFFDEVREWPRKPQGYDFKKNESYIKYRKYIKGLMIKKPDEELLEYFNKTMNYYLTEDNCHKVGPHILSIREELLNQKLMVRQFNPEHFAISKGFSVADNSMEGYADELIYLLGLLFGCAHASITSGNREPDVFVGHPNHVQIAYKAYHYLDAFLKDEVAGFAARCHKNTKRKNRRLKAKWHGQHLVSTMLNSILDDEELWMLLPAEEREKLSSHAYKKVHVYYDENEPIGGWWDPKKNPNQW